MDGADGKRDLRDPGEFPVIDGEGLTSPANKPGFTSADTSDDPKIVLDSTLGDELLAVARGDPEGASLFVEGKLVVTGGVDEKMFTDAAGFLLAWDEGKLFDPKILLLLAPEN